MIREKAAHAWARYLRVHELDDDGDGGAGDQFVVSCSTAGNGMVSVHFYIAAALGIGLTMLLASALMGLVFLSSGTGHDAAAGQGPSEQEDSETD